MVRIKRLGIQGSGEMSVRARQERARRRLRGVVFWSHVDQVYAGMQKRVA